MKRWIIPILILTILMTQSVYADTPKKTPTDTQQQGNAAYSLTFDTNKYSVKTYTLNGQTIYYRSYEDIFYVSNPVEAKFQRLLI